MTLSSNAIHYWYCIIIAHPSAESSHENQLDDQNVSCRDNFKSDEQNVTEDLNQDNGKLGHNVFFVYYSLIISSQQLSYQYCYRS